VPRWRAIRDPAWLKSSAALTPSASIIAALPVLRQLRSACERGRVALDVTRRREKLKRAIAAARHDEQQALEAITQAEAKNIPADGSRAEVAGTGLSDSLRRARVGAAVIRTGLNAALPAAASKPAAAASATSSQSQSKRGKQQPAKAPTAKPSKAAASQSKPNQGSAMRVGAELLPVAVRRRGQFVS
jgi:hypothetical protein